MSFYQAKAVLVSGASSGIGRALCLQLVQQQAQVYAADIDRDGLALLCDEAPSIHSVALDISDFAAFERVIEQIVHAQGRLDYLFNNAGIVVGGDFERMQEPTWHKIVNVNLWGVIHGTQLAYRQMLEQGGGHIVNVASSAGIMPVPRSTAYATTKQAAHCILSGVQKNQRLICFPWVNRLLSWMYRLCPGPVARLLAMNT